MHAPECKWTTLLRNHCFQDQRDLSGVEQMRNRGLELWEYITSSASVG